MNKKANKKNIAGRFLVAGFFVLVTFFSLQTVSQVQAVTGDYNKAATSTLTAFEWNNLISDFISNAGGRINGSLGINTATSTYALDINGLANFTQPVIVGTPTGSTHATTKSYVDSLIAGGAGSTVGYWQMNGANINNSNAGNVGIGTTNPGKPLEINNNTAGGTLDYALKLKNSNGSAINTNLTGIGFSGYGTIKGGIVYQGISAGWNRGNLLFLLNAAGDSTEAGLADAKMIILNNGNVGIGVTNPSQLLQISANADNYLNITASGGSGQTSGLKLQRGTWLADTYTDYSIYNLSGNLYFDQLLSSSTNTRLFIQDSSGNIGVGTTAPSYKLDVAGAGQFTQPVIVGTPTIGSHAVTKSYVDALMSSSVGAGTSGQTLRNNGTSWVADSNLFNTGTNIGIGTTNPSAPFSIVSSSDVDTFSLTNQALSANIGFVLRLPLSTGTNDGKAFGFYAGNESWTRGLFYSDGAYGIGPGNATRDIFLRRYSANNLMIDSNKAGGVANLLVTGNIGIGLTNPSYQLDVAGTSRFNQPVIVGTPTGATHATTKSYVDSLLTGGSGSAVGYWTMNGTNINNNNGGNVGIGTTSPESLLDIRGVAGAAGNNIGQLRIGSPSNSNAKLLIGFNTTALQGYIQSVETGVAYKDLLLNPSGGNVGIGTTTTAYKLDIAGTGHFTQPVIVGTPTGATHAVTKSYVDSLLSSAVGAGITGQTLRNDGTGWVANSTLFNNGTNIGIGITNPVAQLDMYSTSASQGFRLSSDRDDNGLIFHVFDRDETNGGLSVIGSSIGGSNVGIGTITPGARLTVNSSDPDGTTMLDIFDQGDNMSALKIENLDGSQPGIIIKQTGNVGIGTTTPWAKLTVYSTDSDGTSIMDLYDRNDNMSAFKVENLNGSLPGVIIKQTSNVGIAVTNPAYRLEVSGTGSFNQPVIVGTPTGATHATTKSYVDSLLAGGSGSTVGYWAMNGVNINNSNSGNVGIGVTAPTSKLSVNGTIDFDSRNLKVIGHASDGTARWAKFATLNVNSAWQNNKLEYYIRSRSFTGILRFDVNSGSTADANSVNLFRFDMDYSTDEAPIFAYYKSSSTTYDIYAYVPGWNSYYFTNLYKDIDGNGWNIGVFTEYSETYMDPPAGYTVNTTVLASGLPTGVTGQTIRNDNGNWLPSSAIYDNGTNVGIGGYDYDQTAKFAVNGTVGIGHDSATSMLDILSTYAMQGFKLAADRDDANGILFQVYDRDTPSQGLVFTDYNRLGVATTNPAYTLDVVGSGQFTQPVIVGTPTGATHAVTKSYVDSLLSSAVGAGITGQTLRNDGTGWVANSTLFNNGTNIGIGTSNPVTLLDIMGSTTAGATILNIGGNDLSGGAMRVTSTGPSGTTYTAGSSAVLNVGGRGTTPSIRTRGGAIFSETYGNVGIGLTNPAYKLDVTGTGQFTQPVIVGTPTATTHATTKSYVDSLLAGGSGSTVGYWTMNGANISNSNSGNIGIGNTAPAYKLDISGSFSATASSSSIMLDANGNVSIGI